MGCVYCVTNKVNVKQYVGKTIQGIKTRRKQHEDKAIKGSDSSPYFYRALRKHGLDSFEWKIVFESDNNKILCIVVRI